MRASNFSLQTPIDRYTFHTHHAVGVLWYYMFGGILIEDIGLDQ